MVGKFLRNMGISSHDGRGGRASSTEYVLLLLPDWTLESLILTIDSRTSENLISESQAPQYPTTPPVGCQGGLRHIAANGTAMPNRGEQKGGSLQDTDCCFPSRQQCLQNGK